MLYKSWDTRTSRAFKEVLDSGRMKAIDSCRTLGHTVNELPATRRKLLDPKMHTTVYIKYKMNGFTTSSVSSRSCRYVRPGQLQQAQSPV